MMNIRLRILVASLSVAVGPALALAEEPAPGARAEARWNFGAGVGYYVTSYGYGYGAPGTLSSLLSYSQYRVPAVTTSLERRLGASTWLVVGLDGMVSRHREDVQPGTSGYARNDFRQFLATAGVRRVLTRTRSPIEVSAVVVAEGGIYDADQLLQDRFSVTPRDTRRDVTAWLAGAQAGISIDRELTDGLSLRVASPLVIGRYWRSTIRTAGQPSASATDVAVNAVLAPRLELRLLF